MADGRAAEAARGREAGGPKPDPIVSDHATIERIVVVAGALADRGAGTARWAARTIDQCSGLRPQTATVTVTMLGQRTSVSAPAPVRRCLETRIDALVRTEPDRGTVTVRMRVAITAP